CRRQADRIERGSLRDHIERPAPAKRSSLFGQSVALRIGQLRRADESDLVAPRIGAQDPRGVLHVAQRRLAPIGIAGAGSHRKRDAGFVIEPSAVDDLVTQPRAPDDRRVAAGLAEWSVAAADGASTNLYTHG